MRFNDQVNIYKIEKVKDGQGGYIENKSFYKTIYANTSTLRVEKQIQIFGVVNYNSLNLTTMDTIDIDNFCMLIDDVYYKPMHKPKVVKNKTYITLDVLDNAN
mgnify:CR=1 FL=1